VKITIHAASGPRTFEIGERLDLAGDPARELAPGLDGPWRARFSHTASGYQLELFDDDGTTSYLANGVAMRLDVERPRHIEAGDVVRLGAITITIGYRAEALPPAPELDPRERQLLGLVAADLDDDVPRRVLADYWLERGDPRGALIHAQCVGNTSAADALLAEHGETWLEPLRLAGFDDVQLVRGFAPSLVLGHEPLAVWAGLFRLSPVAYAITMRRASHVSNQFGLVTMPATRRTATEQGPVSLKYSMNDEADFMAHERRLLGMFRGPHLARLRDVALGRDTTCLIFADDPRLSRALGNARSPARFDEAMVIELGIQIADGLVELHALGIVHGELGPDHITIARGVAVLHDFAMARGQHALPEVARGSMHTPRYIAPEQVGGRVERASDVWALAMTMSRLLLGRHPVQATDDYRMLLAIRSADVTVPKTTSRLGAVLATVLVADPALRPSAAVFREALAWVAAEAGYPTGPTTRFRFPVDGST
jgi:uncharacterized protein (TIGR02996 family)